MKNKGEILIIDDDTFFCKMKKEILEEKGYVVDFTLDSVTGLEKLRSQPVDLILLDLQLKETSGIDLIPKIKEIEPTITIIILTGHGTIPTAISAIKKGAYDYVTKDVEDEELLLRIEKALEKRSDFLDLMRLRESLRERYSFQNIIGADKKMQEIYKTITTVCNTDVTVLIRGETGSGKELIARAIHFNSPRKDEPFIEVNCAAISETLMESEIFGHEKGAFTGAYKQKPGKIEIADKGTLFLDEIGDMSTGLQAKLLRFLEDRTFERVGGTQKLVGDVRVISATHQDLEKLIAENRFRKDLFYRLNIVQIEIPPLKERIGDIPLLVAHFTKQANARFRKKIEKFSAEAMEELASYNWPGNVRELKNLVERAILTSPDRVISKNTVLKYLQTVATQIQTPETLIDPSLPLEKVKDNIEERYLKILFTRYHGDIDHIAKIAKQTKRSIYNKMKKYGISKKEYK